MVSQNEVNNLLKRIDEWLSCGTFDTDDLDAAEHLLIKCRAEIERLSKPYVPMTDDELYDWHTKIRIHGIKSVVEFEAAVINRAGLEIKHD